MNEFTARVQIIGINPFVRVPSVTVDELLRQHGRQKGPVPVKGSLNGTPFKQTVVKSRGVWRLYLNAEMRRQAGVKVGDTVYVELDVDLDPREVPMHPVLVKALITDKGAGQAFEALTPSRRNEILRYLHSLKSEAAIQRNVEKVVRILQRPT